MSTGLGDRIKKRRTELGWSQEELARHMGLKSKSTICKIEKGEDNLTTTAVKKYADALQTTPSYLMGWGEETDTNLNNLYKAYEYQYRIKELTQEDLEIIAMYHSADEQAKEMAKRILKYSKMTKGNL